MEAQSSAGARVPTLVNICLNALVQFIDFLYDVGETPFKLIEPVLFKCNAEQLLHLEVNSPHLQPKTNQIWKKLTLERYPFATRNLSVERERKVCWRDVYCKLTRNEEELLQSHVLRSRRHDEHCSKGPTVKTLDIKQIPKSVRRRKSSGVATPAPRRFKSSALLSLLKD